MRPPTLGVKEMNENIHTNQIPVNVDELIRQGRNYLTGLNESIIKLQNSGYTVSITVDENNQIGIQATRVLNEDHHL